MAKQKKPDPAPLKDRAVKAALAIAARDGWHGVTFQAIAGETGAGLAELHDLFEDRFDILAAYGRMIDRRMLAQAGQGSDASPRDALFDLIMERFDILNEDRAGVTAVLDGLKTDPKQIILSLPHLGRSMSWMLEAAGVPTSGWQGAARVVGLTGLYIKTLRQWIDDESEDMSSTMAALDKNLERAERWAQRF
jgi:AcrR family transcriptional regulator